MGRSCVARPAGCRCARAAERAPSAVPRERNAARSMAVARGRAMADRAAMRSAARAGRPVATIVAMRPQKPVAVNPAAPGIVTARQIRVVVHQSGCRFASRPAARANVVYPASSVARADAAMAIAPRPARVARRGWPFARRRAARRGRCARRIRNSLAIRSAARRRIAAPTRAGSFNPGVSASSTAGRATDRVRSASAGRAACPIKTPVPVSADGRSTNAGEYWIATIARRGRFAFRSRISAASQPPAVRTRADPSNRAAIRSSIAATVRGPARSASAGRAALPNPTRMPVWGIACGRSTTAAQS